MSAGMQADPNGTAAEQRRAAVQWIAAGLRQSHPGYEPDRRCRSCRHCTKLVDYRCQKHRFTTQGNAVCQNFHKGLDS